MPKKTISKKTLKMIDSSMKNMAKGRVGTPVGLKELRKKVGRKKKKVSPVDEFLEEISEINPEALYPTDMKEAIIGYVERFGLQPLILLDREKCINSLMKEGMSQEESEEFFSFNTIGAWMGEGTPCFATIDKRLV